VVRCCRYIITSGVLSRAVDMRTEVRVQASKKLFAKRIALAESLVRCYTLIGFERISVFSESGSGKSEFCRDYLMPEMKST